jgi:metal-responsive CopG/Arc/MetJ family transcriptional regulator
MLFVRFGVSSDKDVLKALGGFVIENELPNRLQGIHHLHLIPGNCLDNVALEGMANRLTELSDKLIGILGIIHGKLIMGCTG